MGRVQDKVALVTGSASGIGLASARMLAQEGAKVVMVDINAGLGAEKAAEIGGEARFIPGDVSNEADWERVFSEAVDAFEQVHILVNNAGYSGSGEAQDPEHMSLEEWRRINSINLEGVFLGCKHAIPVIAKSGGGAIVNISSLAAMLATPVISAYGASKAGVRQLTKSVAMYCARRGYNIRCNSIHPGMIETPMAAALFAQRGRGDSARGREKSLRSIPLGRLGAPDDVAYAVVYLASDEAAYITGAEFVIDGGLSIY